MGDQRRELRIGDRVRDASGREGSVVKVVPGTDVADHGSVAVFLEVRGRDGYLEHFAHFGWRKLLKVVRRAEDVPGRWYCGDFCSGTRNGVLFGYRHLRIDEEGDPKCPCCEEGDAFDIDVDFWHWNVRSCRCGESMLSPYTYATTSSFVDSEGDDGSRTSFHIDDHCRYCGDRLGTEFMQEDAEQAFLKWGRR